LNKSTSSSENSDATEDTVPVVASIRTRSLISTAMVKLISASGRSISVRAVLSYASAASFISERVAQQLELPRQKVNMTVFGLNDVVIARPTHKVSLTVGSEFSTIKIEFTALIISKLPAPNYQVNKGTWPHLNELQLADPDYNDPSTIDAILGVEIYSSILKGEFINGLLEEPAAFLTHFGWVLFGGALTQIGNSQTNEVISYFTRIQDNSLSEKIE